MKIKFWSARPINSINRNLIISFCIGGLIAALLVLIFIPIIA